IIFFHDVCQIVTVFSEEKVVENMGTSENRVSEEGPYRKKVIQGWEILSGKSCKRSAIVGEVFERGQHDQMIHIPKVKIDRRVVKPGFFGDLPYRERLKALLVDQFPGRFDEAEHVLCSFFFFLIH